MYLALVFMVAVAYAAKLDNAYLPPPPSAKDAGGSDGSLEVPLEPPYVDPYTPENKDQKSWKSNTRNLNRNDNGDQDQFLQNEDEIINQQDLKKGRFISGSYSYTGPDNVLVTVTYKADGRQDRKIDNQESDEDYDEDQDTKARSYDNQDEEEEDEDGGVIPTPSSLPRALARAFDFHKKKQNSLEGKTHKIKKPIRGNFNKNKNKQGQFEQGQNAEGQYGMKAQNGGYQYPPQAQYGAPTIHQGYSYPKQNNYN